MKFLGLPMGMWLLFHRSFRKKMVGVLGFDERSAEETEKKALLKYKEIIAGLPEFEKADRFKMNIVNCAMLSAFYLNMEKKPTLEQMKKYYEKAMMIGPMRAFCGMAGKKKFSEKDVQGMKATAALNAADRNPYSWNMEFLPYPDGSGYEARFSRCGICTLMRELGISEIVPAMCHLDYSMSKAGGTTEFVRQYTLASGGPYCDCGYKKLTRSMNEKSRVKRRFSNYFIFTGCAPLFFGIWGVTVTMPTKLLAKNFPEDVQERLKPRLDELERRGMSRLYEVGMSI